MDLEEVGEMMELSLRWKTLSQVTDYCSLKCQWLHSVSGNISDFFLLF